MDPPSPRCCEARHGAARRFAATENWPLGTDKNSGSLPLCYLKLPLTVDLAVKNGAFP